ncbi:hypothetical protein [Shivajiella indica]|uniref:DUF1634 domain-containing protein n=1 Tax=Shivajiella indica TaxID=872115 RepID=A0ABW5B649_9BACT
MNRLYFSLAAIFSSGIFSYSYWKEWIQIKWLNSSAVLLPEKPEAPYFHSTEELYLRVLLVFAIAFSLIFSLSIFFTLKKMWKAVFFCFVMSMLCILAVMINGAIK